MRLSLLPTGRPPVFQHGWVRSSTARYGRFNLPMGRSPGFASLAPDKDALFGLGFPAAPPLKGLAFRRIRELAGSLCKRHAVTRSQRLAALPPLAGTGFQVQCPPLSRGSSHRSVALLGSLSVVIECLALRDGPRRFRPGFTCPTLLGYRLGAFPGVAYGALTRCGAAFQAASADWKSPLGCRPHDPGGPRPSGLGWSPFARRY
jgi:hypothetical protein